MASPVSSPLSIHLADHSTGQLPAGSAAGFPVAGLDRRFYALVVDRLVAWSSIAAAAWAAYELSWRADRWWPGVALVAGVTMVVWLAFGVALGVAGATPGKAALGLRAVDLVSGT